MRSKILLCLLGASSFGVLFYLEVQGFFQLHTDSIGKFQRVEGTVKRLPAKQFIWNYVGQGSPISLGDTISTGEDSSARVSLFSGAELDLEPGTMVAMLEGLEEIKLNFVTGAGKLHLAAQGSLKTKPKISKKKIESYRNGTIAINTKRPIPVDSVLSQEVSKNTLVPLPTPMMLVRVTAENKIKYPMATLPIKKLMLPVPLLDYPQDGAIIKVQSPSNFKLRWKKPQNASDTQPSTYEVEVNSLSNNDKKWVLFTTQLDIEFPDIPSGNYTWTVRAHGSGQDRGPSASQRWLILEKTSQLDIPKDSTNPLQPMIPESKKPIPTPQPKKSIKIKDKPKWLLPEVIRNF